MGMALFSRHPLYEFNIIPKRTDTNLRIISPQHSVEMCKNKEERELKDGGSKLKDNQRRKCLLLQGTLLFQVFRLDNFEQNMN